MHRGLNGGHLGVRRAKAQLQKRFFWPGWANDVRLAKHQCDQCARHQRPAARHQGRMQPFLSGEPWERLGIDITGPHPTSSKGNRFILTVIDHFTKWVELFPMRNQEAATVAKLVFDKIICVHGCPIQILSDRGKNFESQLFQELCKLLQIDKVRTTAYQPATNGQIERFHATMHRMIAKWVDRDHRNWDDTLPAVAFAYRSSVNEVTGFTPYFLMYGREARIPADLVYGDVREPEPDTDDFVTERCNRFRSAFEAAREHLGAAAKRRKRHYDLRARPQAFPVGSQVWCLNPRPHKGRFRKWQSPYLGPFEVNRQLGPVTYEIRRGQHAQPWTVHVDKLKACTDPLSRNAASDEAEPADNNVAASDEDSPQPIRPRRTRKLPIRFR